MTRKTDNRGLTLVELLVAVAIILMVMPVLVTMILELYDSHASTLSRALAVTQGSNATEEVMRDVRGSVYGDNGALPIVAIATSSFTFFADTDFDGAVERVRYFLDDTTFRKGVIEPTSTSSYPVGNETIEPIAYDIINNQDGTPLFRYFTATSTEITSSSDSLLVRRVSMEVVTEKTFAQEASQVRTQTSASIRNLKAQY
jgi:prepilin-type N-terminal cleavage/methylation domain-containing protein